MARHTPFLVTVDVEPDWGMRGRQAVQETLPRLADLLGRHGVRATFFIVAEMLENCAELFGRTLAGHEVGSHGLTHRVLTELAPAEVEREVVESKRRLEQALQRRIRGFRAPFLRLPPGGLERLAAAGYDYDSSEGAVAPSPRNVRPAAWKPARRAGVTVLPVTALRTGWIPCSLTYLRLMAPLGERLISPQAAILYFHLHELADPRLIRVLPFPMRTLLRRGAGESAWRILDRVFARFGPRAMTCSEFLDCMEQ